MYIVACGTLSGTKSVVSTETVTTTVLGGRSGEYTTLKVPQVEGVPGTEVLLRTK